MKVILLQDVRGVGKKHDIKEVSDGYAAHFLFPKRLAEIATSGKVASINEEKKQHQASEEALQAKTKSAIDNLAGKTITIHAKANEKGNLFESIKKDRVLLELQKQLAISIPADSLKLDAPIKTAGTHTLEAWFMKHSAVFMLNIDTN